jgi:hypothetical protein
MKALQRAIDRLASAAADAALDATTHPMRDNPATEANARNLDAAVEDMAVLLEGARAAVAANPDPRAVRALERAERKLAGIYRQYEPELTCHTTH